LFFGENFLLLVYYSLSA